MFEKQEPRIELGAKQLLDRSTVLRKLAETLLPPAPSRYRLITGSATDQGGRPYQEDRLYTPKDSTNPLFAVIDGMGGHSDGHVAAELAVETLSDDEIATTTQIQPPLRQTGDGLVRQVLSTIYSINRKLVSMNKERAAAKKGTSNAAGAFAVFGDDAEGKPMLVAAAVADSKVFLFSNGKNDKGQPKFKPRYYEDSGPQTRLTQVTKPHSQAELERISRGTAYSSISERSYRTNKSGSVLSGLANNPDEEGFDIDVRTVPLELGDITLVCSDGLWENLDRDVIEHWLDQVSKGAVKPEEAAAKLTALAKNEGGVYCDNISVQIIKYEGKARPRKHAVQQAADEAQSRYKFLHDFTQKNLINKVGALLSHIPGSFSLRKIYDQVRSGLSLSEAAREAQNDVILTDLERRAAEVQHLLSTGEFSYPVTDATEQSLKRTHAQMLTAYEQNPKRTTPEQAAALRHQSAQLYICESMRMIQAVVSTEAQYLAAPDCIQTEKKFTKLHDLLSTFPLQYRLEASRLQGILNQAANALYPDLKTAGFTQDNRIRSHAVTNYRQYQKLPPLFLQRVGQNEQHKTTREIDQVNFLVHICLTQRKLLGIPAHVSERFIRTQIQAKTTLPLEIYDLTDHFTGIAYLRNWAYVAKDQNRPADEAKLNSLASNDQANLERQILTACTPKPQQDYSELGKKIRALIWNLQT